MPAIEVDGEVWEWLKSQARPFEDTPNSVIRRVAGLDGSAGSAALVTREPPPTPAATSIRRGLKTPQGDYRIPILRILSSKKGEADRTFVLRELERMMSHKLTDFDRGDISSGTIRWQKSAEWEVSVMRQEGLLKPQRESRRGIWALTPEGSRIAGTLPPE